MEVRCAYRVHGQATRTYTSGRKSSRNRLLSLLSNRSTHTQSKSARHQAVRRLFPYWIHEDSKPNNMKLVISSEVHVPLQYPCLCKKGSVRQLHTCMTGKKNKAPPICLKTPVSIISSYNITSTLICYDKKQPYSPSWLQHQKIVLQTAFHALEQKKLTNSLTDCSCLSSSLPSSLSVCTRSIKTNLTNVNTLDSIEFKAYPKIWYELAMNLFLQYLLHHPILDRTILWNASQLPSSSSFSFKYCAIETI